MDILKSPVQASLAGLAVAAVLLALWLVIGGGDPIGVGATVFRWLHVLAAVIWVGMIWFVNFIQLPALAAADDAGRATLMRLVVPKVAATFRHAAHATVATGILLLVTSGYLLDTLLYASAVHVAGARGLLLWAGVAGGVAMWVIVHFGLRPRIALLTGARAGTPEEKAKARDEVRALGRVNLVLSIPVTFAMVGAAHLG
ncbi:MAG: hypothetical protein R3D27_00200 [Hyphomicrobiaceae bacterium]